jgi:formylglycine-generating enzyme required for sulfatase activity
MKKVVTIILCFLATCAFAQKKKDVPPGFEWVKKRGLVISRTEVTVSDWVDFMNSQGEETQRLHAPASNPVNDKCICSRSGNSIKVFDPKTIVYRDTSFVEVDSKKGKKTRAQEKCINMPITGITVKQAQAFAAWVTERYSLDGKYADLSLTFRLPTPDEVDSLLTDIFGDFKPGMENFDAFKNGINSHGCAIYNHAHNSWCDNNKNMKLRYGYGVPMEVNFFFPDWNGLYDLMGNVAEMTSVEGVAKGGSCIHPASACQPGNDIKYDGPQWWLGFRLVAELK